MENIQVAINTLKVKSSDNPKELRGSPTGGDFAVTKTIVKVQERFYWHKVRSNVEKWCRTCDPCAAHKGPRKHSRDFSYITLARLSSG